MSGGGLSTSAPAPVWPAATAEVPSGKETGSKAHWMDRRVAVPYISSTFNVTWSMDVKSPIQDVHHLTVTRARRVRGSLTCLLAYLLTYLLTYFLTHLQVRRV